MQHGTTFHASLQYPVGMPSNATTGRKWSVVCAGSPQYTQSPLSRFNTRDRFRCSSSVRRRGGGMSARHVVPQTILNALRIDICVSVGIETLAIRNTPVTCNEDLERKAKMSASRVQSNADAGAVAAASVTVALLVLLIALLLVGTSLQSTAILLPPTRVPRRLAGLGLAPGPAGAVVGTPLKVIPLTWSPSGSVYVVAFAVGKDTVEAAFDTGSARFIVATNACSGCDNTKYNPVTSADAIALIDPRKQRTVIEPLRPTEIGTHQDILCSDTVSYVSQSNSIVMYRDTVTFPRRTVLGDSICDGTSIDAILTASVSAPVLTVTDFPVGGITKTSGSTALNVFGMSGVLSVTKVGKQFLLPSCQVSDAESFEAATIQAIALYYTARGQPVVWSQYIGVQTGFMLFGALQLPCETVQYVRMIKELTQSSNDVDRTPWRFYTVNVFSIEVDGVALPHIPKQFIVDTGATQTQLPGPYAASTASRINNATSVVITLGSGTARDVAKLKYTASETRYASSFGSQPVFTAMPDNVAQLFSSSMDVGMLGVTAMRNTYVEYDLTNRRIGFSKM